MTSPDPLIAYLAEHDAPCPGCYRNLRGQIRPECPACGTKLRLSEVRVWHGAHGDALTNPMPVPDSPESISTEAYLAKFDVRCLGCGYSLRGLQQSTCPECAREIRLQEFTENPRPKYQRLAAADAMVVLNLIPLAPTAILMLWGMIGSVSYDTRYTAFYGSNLVITLGIAWLLVSPTKRLFRHSLWYFVAINPITIIATLFFLSMVLDSVLFG